MLQCQCNIDGCNQTAQMSFSSEKYIYMPVMAFLYMCVILINKLSQGGILRYL